MGLATSDLSTSARIRQTAMRMFPERGYEEATLRAIASKAGVSAALIVHHFGSKEGLLEACDQHVLGAFHDWKQTAIKERRIGDASLFTSALEGAPDLMRYLAWAFTEPQANLANLFDEMVEETVSQLEMGEKAGMIKPGPDRRHRAAMMIVMRMGGFMLSDHLSRALGVDVYSEEGMLAMSSAGLDIIGDGILTAETAADARAGLDAARATLRNGSA